jgi:hypothetical protein
MNKRQLGVYTWEGRFKTSKTDPTWDPFYLAANRTFLSSPTAVFSSNEQLKLLSKLSEKAKGHDFNMAVAAAEGSRTVALAEKTLRTLARSYTAVRQRDFPAALRLLGVGGKDVRPVTGHDAASAWLEMQYGWRPLVSDVYEASKAFAALTSSPRKQSVRASISRSQTIQNVNSPYYYNTYSESRKRSIRYEATESMTAQRQLGLLDPATVLWEIIPYSFVVDWFLPIGSYLDNLNQIPNLVGRFVTTDIRERKDFRWQWAPHGGASDYIIELTKFPSYCDRSSVEVTRTVSYNISVPKPSFNLDGLTKGLRVYNAVALASAAFKGSKFIDD